MNSIWIEMRCRIYQVCSLFNLKFSEIDPCWPLPICFHNVPLRYAQPPDVHIAQPLQHTVLLWWVKEKKNIRWRSNRKVGNYKVHLHKCKHVTPSAWPHRQMQCLSVRKFKKKKKDCTLTFFQYSSNTISHRLKLHLLFMNRNENRQNNNTKITNCFSPTMKCILSFLESLCCHHQRLFLLVSAASRNQQCGVVMD